MLFHDIREHDFMRRFRNGYGRSHTVHTAQLNPLEQVRTGVIALFPQPYAASRPC